MSKNNASLVFLLLFTFTIIGCKKILLRSYGIKKPKVEAGRINDRGINEWLKNISNNKVASFDIMMVNCDVQAWWGEENLRLLNF
ncbi:MAG: hypothetical protein AAF573_03035 [Bacteroidota bacterium]